MGLLEDLNGIDGLVARGNVSAGELCTYRVGGKISVFVELETKRSLERAAALIRDAGISRFLCVGKGSNLLVSDAGFDGVGIRLAGEFDTFQLDQTTGSVTTGGAVSLPVLARATVRSHLGGFEWAVGVPGSVGGAVRMNAGGHGSDMAQSLHSADVLDFATGRTETLGLDALDLDYRHSAIGPTQLVTAATLVLRPDVTGGEETLRSIVSWRREHQPGGPNAGSVFTNPEGLSAGALIDSAGCKGLRVGSAEVSSKHANFIQADPGGSAEDVVALMGAIVERVEETHGVRLHAETRLLGFDDAAVSQLMTAADGTNG